jgi:pimeloyl-ACP methyl ester carboxylesterase
MTTIVFVHGACVHDAAWWWSRMQGPLASRGFSSVAVELPSCGEGVETRGDMYDDADATLRVIDSAQQPVVLVGNSYGGMVITDAGAHEAVEHLVYITAVMPDESEPMSSFAAPTPAPWLDLGEDGTVGLHLEPIRELFLQDCDEETIEGGLARAARQSVQAFAQPPRAAAWRTTPSTYVVCANDLSTSVERQRAHAARARSTIELPTGHHPFLSEPQSLADALSAAVSA